MKKYYEQKLIKVHDKLFKNIEKGAIRILNEQNCIESAYMSRGEQVTPMICKVK